MFHTLYETVNLGAEASCEAREMGDKHTQHAGDPAEESQGSKGCGHIKDNLIFWWKEEVGDM